MVGLLRHCYGLDWIGGEDDDDDQERDGFSNQTKSCLRELSWGGFFWFSGGYCLGCRRR